MVREEVANLGQLLWVIPVGVEIVAGRHLGIGSPFLIRVFGGRCVKVDMMLDNIKRILVIYVSA